MSEKRKSIDNNFDGSDSFIFFWNTKFTPIARTNVSLGTEAGKDFVANVIKYSNCSMEIPAKHTIIPIPELIPRVTNTTREGRIIKQN